MKTLRLAVPLAIVLAASLGWTRVGARKEHVRLQLSTESGAPGKVRVETRGLILFDPSLRGQQPRHVVSTVDLPAEVFLIGLGEAEVRAVDSATALVATVIQVRRSAPAARRLVGRGFRVSRTAAADAYAVTPLGERAVSERR